jgi:HEXXH motif-containing protein
VSKPLDADAWIFSAGATAQWKQVHGKRSQDALARLRTIAADFRKRAPASVKRRGYLKGLELLLRSEGPARERLLGDPALDYWLFLWDKHFHLPSDDENWHLHFGLLQGLAAALALQSGRRAKLDTVLDPDGHLHLYGLPAHVRFSRARALARVTLSIDAKGAGIEGPEGLSVRVPMSALRRKGPFRRRFGAAELVISREVIPGMRVETCGLLAVQGVVMHGLASPTSEELERFCASLRTAFAHVKERDPGLHDELADLVRVIVPLVNPRDHGSVSSSYVNMRGTICLSHSDDPLLQAETLIHEFCHQKMNQLLLADALLEPGQSGQVFYSPWRPDARRLRGLILGAHAFLNVARYLQKALSRESYPLRERISIMTNVARRLFEVEQAVNAVCAHADLTEFGRRFMLAMARETAAGFHGAQWYPKLLLDEVRVACAKHRAEHSLPMTHFHKAEGYNAWVETIRFGQKRVIRRRRTKAVKK